MRAAHRMPDLDRQRRSKAKSRRERQAQLPRRRGRSAGHESQTTPLRVQLPKTLAEWVWFGVSSLQFARPKGSAREAVMPRSEGSPSKTIDEVLDEFLDEQEAR